MTSSDGTIEQKRRYHAAVRASPLRDKIAMLIRIQQRESQLEHVRKRDSGGRHAHGVSGG